MTWRHGEVVRCGGALSRPLQSARIRVEAREGFWLKLTDSEGRVGVGECAPLPGYSTETLEDCRAGLLRWLETRDADLPPAARCAVDGALLDLRGHQVGQPAHELLTREPVSAVPLVALVASVEEARAAVESGFRTLKLKVGLQPFELELRRLRELRRELGFEIALRLDANGSFPLEEAAGRLAALAEVSPELLEEPTSRWTEALAASPVPLALDESLIGGFDPLSAKLASVAVLKPTLLGGPQRCLALAERLVTAGLDLTVSHTWDGPIGLGVAATTALALAGRWPGKLRACGLSRHPGLAAWPVRGLPCLKKTELRRNVLPGLGLTLEPDLE